MSAAMKRLTPKILWLKFELTKNPMPENLTVKSHTLENLSLKKSSMSTLLGKSFGKSLTSKTFQKGPSVKSQGAKKKYEKQLCQSGC